MCRCLAVKFNSLLAAADNFIITVINGHLMSKKKEKNNNFGQFMTICTMYIIA